MTDDSIRLELEELREQLAELRATRESKGVEETDVEAVAAGPPGNESDDANKSEVMSQLRTLLDSIEKDIRETKPLTLIVVFAVGLLFGRLLPR